MAFSLNILTRLLAAVREETSQLLPPIAGYEKEPLLPLKEACRPLKHILNKELKTNITIALINVQRPRDGLTPDEAAALYLYSMQWSTPDDSLYYVLNDTLRMADREELVPWHRYLKLLLTAFFKLPPSKHQVVWRGIRGDWSRNYPKERKFTWWALTSCTLSLDVLQSSAYLGKSGPRTLFNVETKSGKSIKHHSYFAAEDEVLLPPGIYLEVISQLSSSKDLCIIHLREATPPYKLVHDPFNLNERPQLINSYGSRQQSVSVTSTPKSQRKSHHKTLESRRREPISILNTHDLIQPVSHFNDKYRCTIVKVELLPSTINVHIDVRGDSSIGPLQPPLMSTLGVHEHNQLDQFISPAHGQFSVSDPNAQYLGSLTFLIDRSYFKNKGVIGFRYGMDGYSIAQLFRFDERELDRLNL